MHNLPKRAPKWSPKKVLILGFLRFFALFGPPGGHLKPLGRLLAALRIPGPPQDPFFNNFLRIWSRALLKTLPFLCKPRTMLHTLAAQCPELVQNPGAAVHRLACSINQMVLIGCLYKTVFFIGVAICL